MAKSRNSTISNRAKKAARRLSDKHGKFCPAEGGCNVIGEEEAAKIIEDIMAPPFRPEKGAAGLIITLKNSVIEVRHGSDKTLLALSPKVTEGTWRKLLDFIKHEIGCKWIE